LAKSDKKSEIWQKCASEAKVDENKVWHQFLPNPNFIDFSQKVRAKKITAFEKNSFFYINLKIAEKL